MRKTESAMRLLTTFLFGLLIFVANVGSASSAKVLMLQNNSQHIAYYAQTYLDPESLLSAEKVWSSQGAFSPVNQNQISVEVGSGEGFWVYLAIENPQKVALSRILEIDYPLTSIAEIYQITAGSPALLERISLEQTMLARNIIHRNPAFQFVFQPLTKHEYLIKLQFHGKANHALELNPVFYTTGGFYLRQLTVHIFFAAFLAFLSAVAIYNIILSSKVGIIDHAYYSLYLICYIFLVLLYEGFIFYFPAPIPVQWVVAGMSLVPIYTSVALMAFGRKILRLNRFYPQLDQYYKYLSVGLLVLSPITVLYIAWLNLAMELVGAVAAFALGVLAIMLHQKGLKQAKYFAISFVFIALGYGVESSLYSFSAMSWFNTPNMSFTIGLVEQYFFYLCAIIEMIFLALALASYVDQMRADKELAQAEALAQVEEKNKIKSRYTKQLESDIAERTREVREKSLMLSDKNEKLRELDDLKSRFFANISHEFRAPLTLIRAPFQQMLSGSYGVLNPQLQEAAVIGGRNSDRLNRLIEELLVLSKLESGQLQLMVGEHDINAFLRRTASLFKHTSLERNIEFVVDTPFTVENAYFDQDKLETVLYNLLSNGFKYTPSGGKVSLSIEVPEPTKDRGAETFFSIVIRDNGCGIPVAQQSQVFERFYRMSSAEQSATPGSGIGLALAKDLVELHGGLLSVSSEVDMGSEFIIRLPCGKTHFSEDELSALRGERSIPCGPTTFTPAIELAQETTQPRLSADRPTLLLVEDNADMRQFIKSLFPTYNILEACHGLEALKLLEEKKTDVIVSDIMMPEMDGLTLLERLREQEKFQHLPFLLLTARAAEEDRIMALRIRADDYLAKPFDAEELQLRVRNLLERVIKANQQQERKKEHQFVALESLDSADQVFLNQARQLVLENLSNAEFNVNKLAESLYVSKNTLHRRMEKSSASSPAVFMRSIRLEHAHQLIQNNSRRTMAEVAYEVGFSSPGYFSKLYKQYKKNLPI